MATMDAVYWVAIVLLVGIAASIATYAVTRMRMERRSAGMQAQLHEALATVEAERRAFREGAKAIEEAAKRKAMDEFLAEMRVEERHFVREHKILFARRRSVVMQERIFFRNIPLSNWVEHEVPVEEGADLEDLTRTVSIFNKVLEIDGVKPQRDRKMLSADALLSSR
jgi:hypothetical protein